MSPTARRLWLSDYLMPLCKVFPSQDLYEHALGIHERFGVSLYDSSIVSAACLAGCKLLLTEDLQDGQKIDSVRVRNPFL